MITIKVAGRGGQGSVTSARILAIAAFNDGKQSQAFPNFGVERRGAPSYAYVRIDDKKIMDRSFVYEPDYLVVLDSSLLDIPEAIEGVKKHMTINGLKINHKTKTKSTWIDATEIALKELGRPIVNTAVLGAFAAATKVISLNGLVSAIDEVFEGELAEKNKEIIKKAYQKVSERIS